jgi:hypothetical protein
MADTTDTITKRPRDIHFKFWILAIVNWTIAVACWGVSAYLGIASPTGIFVYTILFVVAIVAVIVGVLSWLVARFGRVASPLPDGARD